MRQVLDHGSPLQKMCHYKELNDNLLAAGIHKFEVPIMQVHSAKYRNVSKRQASIGGVSSLASYSIFSVRVSSIFVLRVKLLHEVVNL